MQKGHGALKGREQRERDTEGEGREGETYRKRERESRGPALNTDNRESESSGLRSISTVPAIPSASLFRPLLGHKWHLALCPLPS